MIRNEHLIKLGLIACFISLIFVSASAQSKKDLGAIETYCKQIDVFIKSHKKSARVWATVDADGKQWREFESEKVRQESAPDGDAAMVWLRNGKLIYAGFTLQSDSRDWAHYVNYYFRADGTLARIDAKLNTFYGYMSVARKQHYSPQGKLLKSSVQYLDLKTQKKKKPGDDFIDEPFPVYRNIKSLPFYALLGRKK